MKDKIDFLIKDGLTDHEISEMLNISRNTVKSRRQRFKNKKNMNACLFCGNEFTGKKHGRKKQFCSYECRIAYWNKRKSEQEYELECLNCGRTFISKGNPNKKYCSRRCYCEQVKKYEKENQ